MCNNSLLKKSPRTDVVIINNKQDTGDHAEAGQQRRQESNDVHESDGTSNGSSNGNSSSGQSQADLRVM